MSGYKGHLIYSVLIGVIAYSLFFVISSFLPIKHYFILSGVEGVVMQLFLLVFFGLFPDIDTKSKFQVTFYFALFLINGFLIYKKDYQTSSYLGFLALLPIFSKHRGWTHSFWAAFLMPALIFLLPILKIILIICHYILQEF